MNEEVYQKFATKLQELRKAKKFSKGQLSVEAECSKSYIGKIESGQNFPNFKMLVKLANALEVPLKELFDFEYEIKNDN